jgi:hypothetical protein
MKRILLIALTGLLANGAFAQCTFKETSKKAERNDQYSKSSASDIKSSQTAMSKQVSEFQKPKYASVVKPSKEFKKQQKEQQKEQQKKEQAEL